MKEKNADDKIVAKCQADHQRCPEEHKRRGAWEREDDNTVCNICGVGESTGENHIIFCDSCGVFVHQHCYGIENVSSW